MSEEQVVVPQDDPFYDPDDTQLDLSTGPKHLADLTSIANEELPSAPEAVAEPEPIEVAPPEPEQFTFDDGSTATIEKTSKGWKAVLDSKTGAPPEVFYGRTKDEMYQNVMAGKIQATKKIREQNRAIKLGNTQPQVQEAPAPRSKILSADDIAQLKLQLADNPDLALATWFQKKSGRSFEELMAMAEDGRRARQIAEADNTSRAFMAATPDYHASPANYQAVLGWISRYKLNKILSETNAPQIMFEVYDNNLWTVEVLSEAYEDLTDNGLLEVLAPVEEVEEEVPPPPPPAPTAIRRPRPAAGLGIRANEARAARVAAPEDAPQNLEDLSNEEIEKLFAGVRKMPASMIKESLEKSRRHQ